MKIHFVMMMSVLGKNVKTLFSSWFCWTLHRGGRLQMNITPMVGEETAEVVFANLFDSWSLRGDYCHWPTYVLFFYSTIFDNWISVSVKCSYLEFLQPAGRKPHVTFIWLLIYHIEGPLLYLYCFHMRNYSSLLL